VRVPCVALTAAAGGFTLLTWITGQQHWDALGSIAVGVLMGGIALQLMRTNKRFLIGGWWPACFREQLLVKALLHAPCLLHPASQPLLLLLTQLVRVCVCCPRSRAPAAGQAMEPAVERSIVQHLHNDNMVVKVIDPKSEEIGDGVFRCGLESRGTCTSVHAAALVQFSAQAQARQVSARPSVHNLPLFAAICWPFCVLVGSAACLIPVAYRCCRFKAEIQWSGEHVVQKYLSELRRESLYRQLRAAACTLDLPQQTAEDAIDIAMVKFGERVDGCGGMGRQWNFLHRQESGWSTIMHIGTHSNCLFASCCANRGMNSRCYLRLAVPLAAETVASPRTPASPTPSPPLDPPAAAVQAWASSALWAARLIASRGS
jgi:hypothetical protein